MLRVTGRRTLDTAPPAGDADVARARRALGCRECCPKCASVPVDEGKSAPFPSFVRGNLEPRRGLWGQPARIGAVHAPAAMALTPAQFKAQLGSTPQQALAIDTLFSNPV